MFNKGKYIFKVTNQGFSESKEKKTPFFFLEGVPTAFIGEDGQQYDAENPNNYTRTISFYITENTIDRVTNELKKLGWPGGRFATLEPSATGAHSFIGQEIEVDCKHEPGTKGDGKMMEKWELPYEGKASEPKQSTSGIASKLDKLFGGKLAQAAKPKAVPARKPVGATAATDRPSGDDVPF